jgi:hypothetical protein
VFALWQRKDLAARTANEHMTPEQVVAKGESYIPEIVEVKRYLLLM